MAGQHATFQPGREVDDAVEAARVASRAARSARSRPSRFATGRKNALAWEINGSKGSLAFDLERLNELQVHLVGSRPGARAQGFRTVLVTEADHPFWAALVAARATSSAGSTRSCTSCITCSPRSATTRDVGAARRDFEDGYRAAEVCDAMLRSSSTGAHESVTYR